MKESPSERIQEISASKFRINVLGSNNIQNNIANDIKPSLMNNVILNDKPQLRRRQNNNEFNLGNNELNTSNTNENNIPSASTILLQKIVDKADILVIATGSMASPKTGSDGKGYELSKSLGHKVIKPLPGLVQLVSNNKLF